MAEALQQVEGAYSLVLLTRDRLIAARDPRGFRPLCLGQLDGAVVVASETCAFDLLGARYDGENRARRVCGGRGWKPDPGAVQRADAAPLLHL